MENLAIKFSGNILGFSLLVNFVYAAGGLVKIALQPSDLDFKYQKNYLERVNIPAAWDYQIKGNLRPVIAILDSGVDIDNPDLKQIFGLTHGKCRVIN